jgi:hypothetical protein
MKKKQVIVVKKIDKLSPKKEVYISRRAVNSDSIENDEWKESFVGNPAPQVRKLPPSQPLIHYVETYS